MLRLAMASALLSRPMWWTSAPQQPAPGATSTSTPRRASRRMVASLISGRSTCWAQPASRITRFLRSPSVAAVPGPAKSAAAQEALGRQLEHGHQLLEPQRAQQRHERTGEAGGAQRQTEALGIGHRGGDQRPRQPLAGSRAGRSSRCARGCSRRGACSRRRSGRWSCTRGRRGSGRHGAGPRARRGDRSRTSPSSGRCGRADCRARRRAARRSGRWRCRSRSARSGAGSCRPPPGGGCGAAWRVKLVCICLPVLAFRSWDTCGPD